MPCLLLDHDRNCDLDAYGIHHLSNGSPSSSQQDRSDLMKAPAIVSRSAHESDVFVSNVTTCLSFGPGCAHESDISSSTVQCSGSELETSYGSDIPFLAEIAVDTEYAHGFPPTSIKLPLVTETRCGYSIFRSTDTVCLSCDTRFVLESDLQVSKEIPIEPETAYGSENLSWIDSVCLSSEPEASHESDLVVSTDTAFLPCEPGPAYASAVPFLTETRCLQFDCDTANEPDIPFTAETLFGFGFAYESDVLDLTVCPPSEVEPAYASDDAFSTEITSESKTHWMESSKNHSLPPTSTAASFESRRTASNVLEQPAVALKTLESPECLLVRILTEELCSWLLVVTFPHSPAFT
eukprot:SAG31_NODE_6920_length_1849_cov_2.335429_1_plen_352_part_00